MNVVSTISTWTDILQQFFPIFTAPGTEVFSRLMTGWILCTTRRTITGILPFADPCLQHAHDAYHRFFPDSSWEINRFWQILTLILVKLFYPTGIIIIALDDTLFHTVEEKSMVPAIGGMPSVRQRKVLSMRGD